MEGQKRKKWTPVDAPDDTILKLREKRKWQIALRRYIIEKNKCLQYAPYFGLDIAGIRLWIEAQFTDGLGWDNFSEKWQLDHVIPVNYFDFGLESDLKLCWHFINIRVSPVAHEGPRPDLLGARHYFSALFDQTSLPVCRDMIAKIDSLQLSQPKTNHLSAFLSGKRTFLDAVADFSVHEFEQLNQGVHVDEVLAERMLLRNFG